MSFQLEQFLPYRLSVAAAQVSRRFATYYEGKAGLSVPEWRVLAHLSHSGKVSVRDIHHRVNLDKSMVSRAASRLQQAGFLKKTGHGSDRRLIVLELTEDGRSLMAELGKDADAFQERLLQELGVDADAFNRALARLMTEQPR